MTMKRIQTMVVFLGLLMVGISLFIGCEATQAGIPALSWPEGREPVVIPGIGEFQLQAGRPEGDATLLLYYYGMETTPVPEAGANSGLDWENWTRLVEPGLYSAQAGSYHLYAVASDAYGNAARSKSIPFVVSSVPTWTLLPGVDISMSNQFSLTSPGSAVGTPEPELKYYYASAGTSPPDADGDWNDFTEISAGAIVTGLSGGDYDLYGLALSGAASAKSDKVSFTVNGASEWSSAPTVDTSSNGQFIVNPGVVLGGPAPTVVYYYASAGTSAPAADSEDWTSFTEVVIDEPIIVTGGDYILYGTADNTGGANNTVRTAEIAFTVQAATLDSPPSPGVDTAATGEFTVTAVTATGEPTPELKYYYAAAGTPVPTDDEWTAFTDITTKVEAGEAIITGDTSDTDYDLYAVATNNAGSKNSPVRTFTVTAAVLPTWGTLPAVTSDTRNEFTITAGTLSAGTPTPTVKYYYGDRDQAALTSAEEWEASYYFEEVIPGEVKTVRDGDYDLYGVAVNNAGTGVSDVVEFQVEASIEWDSAPVVAVTLQKAASPVEWKLEVTDSMARNTVGVVMKFYYGPDTAAPPADAGGDWPGAGFTVVDTTAILAGGVTLTAPSSGSYHLHGTAENSYGSVISPPRSFLIETPEEPSWTSHHSVTVPAITDTNSFRLSPAEANGFPAPTVTYYYGTHVDSPSWQTDWTPTDWTDNGYEELNPNEDVHVFPDDYDVVAVATNALSTIIANEEVTVTGGNIVSLITAPTVDSSTAGSFTITAPSETNSSDGNVELAYYYIHSDDAPPNDIRSWTYFETSDWTKRNFNPAEFNIAKTVSPGDYHLYGVARGGGAVKVSLKVEFTVN